jgi:MtN3 and saliva related transmembrane protein
VDTARQARERPGSLPQRTKSRQRWRFGAIPPGARPGRQRIRQCGHRHAAPVTPGLRARGGGYHPDCLQKAVDMEWMGYLAALLTTVAFVPQALKTIRSRDTGGISLAMYVVFTIGIACWFGYGVWLGSWPMILSNIVTFVLAATILGLKLKHG